jgi:iron complex transport system substrate-binding protein
MYERTLLGGLVVAMAGVAALVQARAPGGLLPPPDRPDRTYEKRVVMGSPAYPREAIGADGVHTRIAHAPQRIVSQFWSIDEYLYAIVPPERIVGVSETAYLQASSNVLPFVDRFHPVIATDPEIVLRANPDLVLTDESARWELPGLLRQAGVPVHRIYSRFETLQAIEDNIRLIGYLTGEDARAEQVRRDFHDAIARAAAMRPANAPAPRVLGLGGTHTYGRETLFNDVLRVLGAENVAATHGLIGYDGITDEHIARWDPDWIIAGANRGQAATVRAQLLARPSVATTSAVRQGHVVVIENDVFYPMSPYTSRLVGTLAGVLYGGANRGR